MDAVIAIESDLNSILKEYLEYLDYSQTSSAFDDELSALGKQVKEIVSPRDVSQKDVIQNQLIDAFKGGSYEDFFVSWNKYVPVGLRDIEATCKKLEFNLNIYFAVYPVLSGKQRKQELEKSMGLFKAYLENQGSALSQTTEFLPYYALPFVPDPTAHPSFKPIFVSSWSVDLLNQLEAFLNSSLKSEEKPQLYKLYKFGPEQLEQERMQHADNVRLLQLQLAETERRSTQYYKSCSKLQADYHKLIGIAAELVDSLEDAVRGKMVTPEYLQDICARLFSTSNQASVDITKPGTASSILRASLVNNGPGLAASADVPFSSSLDYEGIKTDLLSLSDRKKSFLLQALRWRLTQTVGVEQRDSVVRTYIAHDLIACSVPGHHRDGVLKLFTSPSEVVREYTARLFNSLASFSAGRSYLSQNHQLVQVLHSALVTEAKSSLTCENILGTLQKLSLRRRLQSLMIDRHLIEWLVQLLDDHDNLSDYTLEYSVALLMNLCLRSAGKRSCITSAGSILKVLTDLLGHENQEIRPYVNGALYSILALPAVKEEARAMGMEEILECFLNDENPDMTRQIQFIIRQLNSDDPAVTNDPESDDEDEDDDDEEGDAIDAELDKNEKLDALPGELSGEKLLALEYSCVKPMSSVAIKSKKTRQSLDPDHPLTRPTTPGIKALEPVTENAERPSTTTIRSASDEGRPRTSGSRQSSKPTPKTISEGNVSGAKKVQVSSVSASEEYRTAFSSRPKIPREPDPQSQVRPRTSSPPPPGRSASPPRPPSNRSRPGSGSSRISQHSSQQKR